MAREIEANFRLPDAAALRQRLATLGAQRVSTVQETNLILDSPARQLLGHGCGLRVRVAEPADKSGPRRVTLTFKGPRDPDEHGQGIKAREEIETDADDDASLLAILARLDFTPVLCYEKRRETWQLGDAEVVLDELPKLGWFAEIEATDSARIESLRAQLGLDPATAVAESYPELIARHGTPDTTGTRVLRFATNAV